MTPEPRLHSPATARSKLLLPVPLVPSMSSDSPCRTVIESSRMSGSELSGGYKVTEQSWRRMGVVRSSSTRLTVLRASSW